MTTNSDANTRTRTISALAVGATLLSLSAPIVHATPDNGPGTEPSPPYGSSDKYPSLTPPPLMASQNPVVFYGSETEKDIDLTWTPYPWGPVQFRYEAIGGTQLSGTHPPIEPSVTDPHAPMEVTYGRTYHVWLKVPWPSKLVGPTLTITTVKIGLAPADPQPPRVDSAPIPGDNRRPDPPGTRRLDPGAAAGNTGHTSESSQGENSAER
ncbi:hypothetical protein [Mycolicibacterium stellerae]|uniref:hypothetical protein n=1 Tax=Mycolicibacterium stellerae TaxID=2358193 RepID=UPI0013DE2C08|nr:hypothetical protein [Mycolicibacterium stellerae]